MAASSPTDTGPPASFRPYVPDSQNVPELTWSAVLLGAVLGILFGASSLYLFLKVGMTVSASIPVSVLSITIFRALSKALKTRRATILENNVVQTAGSAGESIAFGVGATMPALMILGSDMDPQRVMLVSVLGGMLGILMMIPLRKAFIVNQHATLPYPEGSAAAKILIVGEQGGSSARTVFTGFGLGFGYQVLMDALKLWGKEPSKAITGVPSYNNAVVTAEVSPALVGVGYIIGPRVASIMVAGGLLAALVLVPAITFFGSTAPAPIEPGTKPIAEMSAGEVSGTYVRYIGAGAVAAGGIISMLRALPLIIGSIVGSFRSLGGRSGSSGEGRTQRDTPSSIVILGCIALVAAIASSSLIPTNTAGRIAGGLMILAFGFLFVTVSSRVTGLIGSSSNPISGMTIATLLLTCLIFYLLNWVAPEYRLAALAVAAIVCIASSNGGTTAQDLKTGQLVGATPWKQQVAIAVGAVSSAIVIGFILIGLNKVSEVVTRDPANLPTATAPVADLTETVTRTLPDSGSSSGGGSETFKVWRVTEAAEGVQPGKYHVDPTTGKVIERIDPGIGGILDKRDDGTSVEKFNPPQPELFALLINGILKGKLAWALIVLGAGLAIVMQLCGVSALAFAVGVYLPLSTTMPIFIGGIIRGVVEKARKMTAEESDSSPAVLLSSGLIAGGSIAGILIAVLAILPLNQDFHTTDALPASVAPADALGEEVDGPGGQKFRTWDLKAPADGAEPGTYLVDDSGKAVHRLEKSTSLDLPRQLGLPRDWHSRPLPSLLAFAVLLGSLLWTGLRGPKSVVLDSADGPDGGAPPSTPPGEIHPIDDGPIPIG
jgi:putative OPT family oligopeptide transporter